MESVYRRYPPVGTREHPLPPPRQQDGKHLHWEWGKLGCHHKRPGNDHAGRSRSEVPEIDQPDPVQQEAAGEIPESECV